ncbi:N-acetyltransferase [Sphaerisporangium krabiense]|uniref:N-acetyltransferase domain-containing protein n=1 Tax=Sphaerisporangium krabiense TaxID=763782 RepID=A0A7W8Z0G8_9ACTN|nr:GNAT family N-acetyltransferase [Sphaerisporangium krabiense]MBB5625197.1 hypothetical protein [Sphaerisporangium krabiense]GII64294.1 N-acetyltransferase [Sphaerisporangium krabiense]
MTVEQHDLTMRPITGREELGLFNRLPYVLNDELAGDLDAGRRRPEWMWVALRGDRLAGRVAWWGRAGADTPYCLDVFDLDDAGDLDTGVLLLRTAMAGVLPAGTPAPEYICFAPSDWREKTATRHAVHARMTALERTGARLFVERLSLEWRAGTPVPEPGGRLAFRPFAGRDEIVSLMTSVLDGTLDAHGRHDLTRMSPREAATRHYEDELARYPTPRDWWRVATLPGGEPVGFVFPARNDYNPIIAYIGVLPRHRGNGHIDEILAEGTRVLAAEGAPRVRAATDVGNVPMANAFHRAGYVTYQRLITMTWP